jgi:hypothetical protein
MPCYPRSENPDLEAPTSGTGLRLGIRVETRRCLRTAARRSLPTAYASVRLPAFAGAA